MDHEPIAYLADMYFYDSVYISKPSSAATTRKFLIPWKWKIPNRCLRQILDTSSLHSSYTHPHAYRMLDIKGTDHLNPSNFGYYLFIEENIQIYHSLEWTNLKSIQIYHSWSKQTGKIHFKRMTKVHMNEALTHDYRSKTTAHWSFIPDISSQISSQITKSDAISLSSPMKKQAVSRILADPLYLETCYSL